MAGIFSLGNVAGNESSRETNNNSHPPWGSTSAGNGMILYKNEEIYQKGFELWQQYVQFHHHQHHQQQISPVAGAGGGSSAARCMMRSGMGSGGVSCQDCGNQAKKDCEHMRCRTCCKSRGFECGTHVRSTWVPAAKRRERQQRRLASTAAELKVEVGGGDDGRQMGQKRQRDNSSTNNSIGLELGHHFPAELNSTAVFQCVRVHSTDDSDEQLAYQTAINIGGRHFKGILYDQGPESQPQSLTPRPCGKDSSANLMIRATSSTASHHESTSAGATLLDSNAMYSPPISSFLAGMHFFPRT